MSDDRWSRSCLGPLYPTVADRLIHKLLAIAHRFIRALLLGKQPRSRLVQSRLQFWTRDLCNWSLTLFKHDLSRCRNFRGSPCFARTDSNNLGPKLSLQSGSSLGTDFSCGKKLEPPREMLMSVNCVTGSFSMSKVTRSPPLLEEIDTGIRDGASPHSCRPSRRSVLGSLSPPSPQIRILHPMLG